MFAVETARPVRKWKLCLLKKCRTQRLPRACPLDAAIFWPERVSACLCRVPGLGPWRMSALLAFDNLHTGEKLKVEYWAEGQYLPDALAQVNHVLRDFRSGEVHPLRRNCSICSQCCVLGLETASRSA